MKPVPFPPTGAVSRCLHNSRPILARLLRPGDRVGGVAIETVAGDPPVFTLADGTVIDTGKV